MGRTSSETTNSKKNDNANKYDETTRLISDSTRLKHSKRKNSDGSLDFERIVNDYSIQAKREQLLRDDPLKRHSASIETTRWILTIACALISGLTTVMIVSATERLVAWRSRTLATWLTMSNTVPEEEKAWFVFGAYCLVSLLLADASAALCLYWPGVPEAVGSGIPEVKAYLNGIRVKKFNNPTLLLVKMVGSVLSVGSSMAVGMEGPLVMIGAYAGATLAHCGTTLSTLVLKAKAWKNWWSQRQHHHRRSSSSGWTVLDFHHIDPDKEPILHWLWVWATSDLSYFANDAERRKLITIGAACGFAASFGAPIGGMLFIMDDISTFFDQGMFLRILVANSVGTFCLAYYRGDLSHYGAIEFGSYNGNGDNSIKERFFEIPFWILMGIVGGVLGGGFCKAFGDVKKSSGKQFHSKSLKMLRISYMSLINSTIMFLLPMMTWVCRDDETNSDVERRFFCKEGQSNQMASIFFGSRGKAIVRILSDPGQFYASTLAIVGFVFYGLMLYTNTTSIPSGLFTPIVVSGASLGGAYGVWLKEYVDENVDPSSFALLGVGAMMAGIQRSTVSTCVILVEGTGQMRILLPVMIVVVIANYVAQMIYEDGVYEVLMKLKGYPYLSHDKDDCYDIFSVRDIMSSPPVTVRGKEPALRLVEILRKTTHNGFPVVDEHDHFKGLVRRRQIVALMEFGIFEKVGSESDTARKSIVQSQSSIRSTSSTAGQGLMNFAYHIKDDRYNDVIEEADEEDPILVSESEKKKKASARWKVLRSAVKVNMIMNENRRILGGDITMPAIDISKLDTSNIIKDDDSDAGIDGGGDDIDSGDESDEQLDDVAQVDYYKTTKNDTSVSESTKESIQLSSTAKEAPIGFARVGRRKESNVVIITWLNPENKDDVVDLEAVMNRGAYTVTEDFPVSKAYKLFTLLGLRWIVVVGGTDGATVVGLLTRESFIDSNLKGKAGVDAGNTR